MTAGMARCLSFRQRIAAGYRVALLAIVTTLVIGIESGAAAATTYKVVAAIDTAATTSRYCDGVEAALAWITTTAYPAAFTGGDTVRLVRYNVSGSAPAVDSATLAMVSMSDADPTNAAALVHSKALANLPLFSRGTPSLADRVNSGFIAMAAFNDVRIANVPKLLPRIAGSALPSCILPDATATAAFGDWCHTITYDSDRQSFIAAVQRDTSVKKLLLACASACVNSVIAAVADVTGRRVLTVAVFPRLSPLADLANATAALVAAGLIEIAVVDGLAPPVYSSEPGSVYRGLALARRADDFEFTIGFIVGSIIGTAIGRLPTYERTVAAFRQRYVGATAFAIDPAGSTFMQGCGSTCRDAPGSLYLWVLRDDSDSTSPSGNAWGTLNQTELVVHHLPCTTTAVPDAAPIIMHGVVDSPRHRPWSDAVLAVLGKLDLQVMQVSGSTPLHVARKLALAAQTFPKLRGIVGQLMTMDVMTSVRVTPQSTTFIATTAVDGGFSNAADTTALDGTVDLGGIADILPTINWQLTAMARAIATRRSRSLIVCAEGSCLHATKLRDMVATSALDANDGVSLPTPVILDVSVDEATRSFDSVLLLGDYGVVVPLFGTSVGGTKGMVNLVDDWIRLGASNSHNASLYVLNGDYPFARSRSPVSLQSRVHTTVILDVGSTFDEMLENVLAVAYRLTRTTLPFALADAMYEASCVRVTTASADEAAFVSGLSRDIGNVCRSAGTKLAIDAVETPIAGCEAVLPTKAASTDCSGTDCHRVAIIAGTMGSLAAVALFIAVAMLVVHCYQRNTDQRRRSSARNGDGEDEEEDEDLAVDVGAAAVNDRRTDHDDEARLTSAESKTSGNSGDGITRHPTAGEMERALSQHDSSSSATKITNPNSSHGTGTHGTGSKIQSLKTGAFTTATLQSHEEEDDEIADDAMFREITRPITVESVTTAGLSIRGVMFIAAVVFLAIMGVIVAHGVRIYTELTPSLSEGAAHVNILQGAINCADLLPMQRAAFTNLPRAFPNASEQQIALFQGYISRHAGVRAAQACAASLSAAQARGTVKDAVTAAVNSMPTALAHQSPLLPLAVENSYAAVHGFASALTPYTNAGERHGAAAVECARCRNQLVWLWQGCLAMPSGVSLQSPQGTFNSLTAAKRLVSLLGHAAVLFPELETSRAELDALTTPAQVCQWTYGGASFLAVSLDALINAAVERADTGIGWNWKLQVPILTAGCILSGFIIIVFLTWMRARTDRMINEEVAATEEDRVTAALLVPCAHFDQLGYGDRGFLAIDKDAVASSKFAIYMHDFAASQALAFGQSATDEFDFYAAHAEVVGDLICRLGAGLDRIISGDGITILFVNADHAAKFALELIVRVRRANIRQDALVATEAIRAAYRDDENDEGENGNRGNGDGFPAANNSANSRTRRAFDEQAGASGNLGAAAAGVGSDAALCLCAALHYGAVTSALVDIQRLLTLSRVGRTAREARMVLKHAKRVRASLLMTEEARAALQITSIEHRCIGPLPTTTTTSTARELILHDVYQADPLEIKQQRRASRRMLDRYFKPDGGARDRYLREALRTAELANVEDLPVKYIYDAHQRKLAANGGEMMGSSQLLASGSPSVSGQYQQQQPQTPSGKRGFDDSTPADATLDTAMPSARSTAAPMSPLMYRRHSEAPALMLVPPMVANEQHPGAVPHDDHEKQLNLSATKMGGSLAANNSPAAGPQPGIAIDGASARNTPRDATPARAADAEQAIQALPPAGQTAQMADLPTRDDDDDRASSIAPQSTVASLRRPDDMVSITSSYQSSLTSKGGKREKRDKKDKDKREKKDKDKKPSSSKDKKGSKKSPDNSDVRV